MTTEKKIYNTAMYSTRDFDQFKKLEYNRDVDQTRISALMESISDHGFLMPILVSENMEVVDGQHRLEAAKRLNYEVTYIKYNIEEDKLPILISTINSVSKNWSVNDYYELWRQRDVESYVWMSDVIVEHNMTFQELYFFFTTMHSSTRATVSKKFKNGSITFTQTQKERISVLCKRFNEFVSYSVLYKELSPAFRAAVREVVKNPEYDEERMMRKLDGDAGRLLNCVNKIDFILQIEKVYNSGERRQVDFLKTKAESISAQSKKKAKMKKG